MCNDHCQVTGSVAPYFLAKASRAPVAKYRMAFSSLSEGRTEGDLTKNPCRQEGKSRGFSRGTIGSKVEFNC